MPVKLIAKTFSNSKVTLESVTTNAIGNNYLLTIALIPSVSERSLNEREKDIAAMFQRANANENAGNPEMQALPVPETASAVDTTATEVIPAK